jgi:hypothetical protein
MPIYPITFSIPEQKLFDGKNIIEKKQLTASLIPGDMSTYIYKTEQDYYKNYQMAYFAITMKKAGWDCLRHYEILANNCIPYFIDIENCPENTLSLFPKDIIALSNQLYNRIKSKNPNNLDVVLEESDLINYNNLLDQLTLYTKEFLTTSSITKYILNTTGHSNVQKILFLNGCIKPDYLRCLTLSGFKTMFGKSCHEYPVVPHLYKDTVIDSSLYGQGFTYTHLLEPELREDNISQDIIINNIKSNYYDIVIYGSYHRGMPFFDKVTQYYSRDKIIMLCGEDIHNCNYEYYSNEGIHLFVREL